MRVRKPKRADWLHMAVVKGTPEEQKELRIWLRTCIGAGKQIRLKRGPEQLSYYHMWYYRPDTEYNSWVASDDVRYYFINHSTMSSFLLRWNERVKEVKTGATV